MSGSEAVRRLIAQGFRDRDKIRVEAMRRYGVEVSHALVISCLLLAKPGAPNRRREYVPVTRLTID